MDARPIAPSRNLSERASPEAMPDDELLAAIGGGDGMALGALYDRYGGLALAVAYRVLGERGAAEDAVQEGFLAVWRHAGGFRAERGSVRSWLLTIVRNAAIDRRRGRAKREEGLLPLDDIEFGLAGSGDDPFVVLAVTLEADQIRRAMAELPGEQREAIELAFFGGLTHLEVSARTGAPLGTIKGRLRLGLKKLRVTLLPVVSVLNEPGTTSRMAAARGSPEGIG